MRFWGYETKFHKRSTPSERPPLRSPRMDLLWKSCNQNKKFFFSNHNTNFSQITTPKFNFRQNNNTKKTLLIDPIYVEWPGLTEPWWPGSTKPFFCVKFGERVWSSSKKKLSNSSMWTRTNLDYSVINVNHRSLQKNKYFDMQSI